MSSDFENIKSDFYNAEQILDIKANPVVKATILSVLTSIPIIGELIDGTIDAVLTNFQQKKREELVSIIISNRENVTSEMVNDIGFIVNFAKTLEAVNRLSSNDKVKYFANLLINGYFIDDKIGNDEFEEYLSFLNELSYRQINMLVLLYDFENKHLNLDSDNKLASTNSYWHLFIGKMENDFLLDKQETEDILTNISKTGMCREINGAFVGYTGGVFYTTKTFRKFIKMIL